MVPIGLRAVAVRMAAQARERGVIPGHVVTRVAARPAARVRSRVDGKPRVIEMRAVPGRRVVTRSAIGVKPDRSMAGVRGVVVVLLVTRHAFWGQAGERSRSVAGRAVQGTMRSGEREPGIAVIESCVRPGSRIVAIVAVLKEPVRLMVGILDRHRRFKVAIFAGERASHEIQMSRRGPGMTLLAIQRNVRSGQRKTRELVLFLHGHPVDEAPGVVARSAVRAQFALVHVLVAGAAGRLLARKIERTMTVLAGRALVRAGQRQSVLGVIELAAQLRRHPRLGAVTESALLLHLFSVRILGGSLAERGPEGQSA